MQCMIDRTPSSAGALDVASSQAGMRVAAPVNGTFERTARALRRDDSRATGPVEMPEGVSSWVDSIS